VRGLAFMVLVFPTAHLPSPCWRSAGALALLVIALTMTGLLIHPRQVAPPAPGGISLTFQNPLGVSLPGPLTTVLIGALSRRTGVPVKALRETRLGPGAVHLRQPKPGRGIRETAVAACPRRSTRYIRLS